MLAGLGAALVIYVLFRHKAAHAAALWGVAFFATFPVSAVLQVPYAESLNLLLLAACAAAGGPAPVPVRPCPSWC